MLTQISTIWTGSFLFINTICCQWSVQTDQGLCCLWPQYDDTKLCNLVRVFGIQGHMLTGMYDLVKVFGEWTQYDDTELCNLVRVFAVHEHNMMTQTFAIWSRSLVFKDIIYWHRLVQSGQGLCCSWTQYDDTDLCNLVMVFSVQGHNILTQTCTVWSGSLLFINTIWWHRPLQSGHGLCCSWTQYDHKELCYLVRVFAFYDHNMMTQSLVIWLGSSCSWTQYDDAELCNQVGVFAVHEHNIMTKSLAIW